MEHGKISVSTRPRSLSLVCDESWVKGSAAVKPGGSDSFACILDGPIPGGDAHIH